MQSKRSSMQRFTMRCMATTSENHSGVTMNLHFKDVPCPCEWCKSRGQEVTGHRLTRYWYDETEPSLEVQAAMDEVIQDAIISAHENHGE